MKLTVEGMTCEHCVGAVKRAVERLGAEAEVNLAEGTVVVNGTDDVAAVRAAIVAAGYTVTSTDTIGEHAPATQAASASSCCGGARR